MTDTTETTEKKQKPVCGYCGRALRGWRRNQMLTGGSNDETLCSDCDRRRVNG
jgi:hypothetical protein